MEQLIKTVTVIRKPRGWVIAQTSVGERRIDDALLTVKKGLIVSATKEAVEKYWPDNSIEGLQRKVAYFEKSIQAAKNWKLNPEEWDFETDDDAAKSVVHLEKKKSVYLQMIENSSKK